MRRSVLFVVAIALLVVGCRAADGQGSSAPEPPSTPDAQPDESPSTPDAQPDEPPSDEPQAAAARGSEPVAEADTDDHAEICGAFRILGRERPRAARSSSDSDFDSALRGFEEAVARAAPSPLRDLADDWLDILYTTHDPQLDAVARGFVALLLADGDTSAESYRYRLAAGGFDEAGAQELYNHVMSQRAETGESVEQIVQRLDPPLTSAIESHVYGTAYFDELNSLC